MTRLRDIAPLVAAAALAVGAVVAARTAGCDDPGHYVIVAEFAVVDPNVSAVEEAMKNNDRPITQEWARRMRSISDGSEPEWGNYDEIYRTG